MALVYTVRMFPLNSLYIKDKALLNTTVELEQQA